MNPHITFVDQSGELGGAELMLLDVARQMRDRCRVVLFQDGPFGDALREAGVEVRVEHIGEAAGAVRKSAGAGAILRAMPATVGLVRRLRRAFADTQVVYANTLKAGVASGLAAKLAGKPMVFHLHDTMTASHFTAMHRKTISLIAGRLASAVVANSQATADALREVGCRPRVMPIVYNGFDVRAWDARMAHPPAQLPDLSDRKLLGVFGRITPWKGQHVLIEAMKRLPDCAAIIVGDALFSDADRRYREDLIQQIAESGLTARVHMLGHRDDIPQLMKRCDVIVHCSTAPEPFGRVVVEGQLACRPVVAADGGGVVEIIDPGQTGMLTPPGDSDALANAVRWLNQNPEQARAIAAAGRESAVARFSLSEMMRGIESVVEQVAPPQGKVQTA